MWDDPGPASIVPDRFRLCGEDATADADFRSEIIGNWDPSHQGSSKSNMDELMEKEEHDDKFE